MPKLQATIAWALSLLLLSSCGSPEPAATENNSVETGANSLEAPPPADPAQPDAPADSATGPAPAPDAVSHPGGYLPPAPAEPEPPAANSSGPDPSGPATEDEYIRNRQ